MMTAAQNSPLPQQIYIIRHGEKPADPVVPAPGRPPLPPTPPFGVDVDGNQDVHSLLPRGWQRSGALAVLFDPAVGTPPAGLRTPGALYSPDYGPSEQTEAHRTYQTIQGLSARLGILIQSQFAEGQEPALAQAILAYGAEVTLICWEHDHIPALAQAIPTTNADAIPAAWPDERFDVIWTFDLEPATGKYTFGQVPQQLLGGDTDTVISGASVGTGRIVSPLKVVAEQ
jgi:hypothetical protein